MCSPVDARMPREPGYCRHKGRDLGYARFGAGAKPTYFPGRYGSPESLAAYNRAKAEWLAGQRVSRPESVRVEDLLGRWWVEAGARYVRNGKPTSEIHVQRLALVPLGERFGGALVTEFGPAMFDALRAEFCRRDWSRSTVNKCLSRVRSLFRWGLGKGIVPAAVVAGLSVVPGARRGEARSTPRKRPVPWEHVAAVLDHVRPPVRCLILCQWYAGMRPGEACAIAPDAVDTTGEPWRYDVPMSVWKLAHAAEDTGQEPPVYWLGPRVREALGPFLSLGPRPFLTRQHRPYTPNAYRLAVAKTCARLGVPYWHPNQLRHSHATEVRRLFGAEAARARLNHANLSTTEIYARRDADVSRKVAEDIG